MPDYGVIDTGFGLKPFAKIVEELAAAFRAPGAFGPLQNLGADSPVGRIMAVMADTIAPLWQLAQSVYNVRERAGAAGVGLDQLNALVGVPRLGKSYSTAEVTFTGADGTVIAVGAATVATTAGDQFRNIEGGTVAGGSVTLAVRALVIGSVSAPAGTLTEIVAVPAGITSCTNAADADVGRNIETDPDYRRRSEEELQRNGVSTHAAIETKLKTDDTDETNISDCVVLENNSSEPDAEGRPGHSIEVVVAGPASPDHDDAVFQKIWNLKAAGIQSVTTATGANAKNGYATDTKGRTHPVAFSLATEIPIWFFARLAVNADFNRGQVQRTTVTVGIPAALTEYAVTVAGIRFSYTTGAVAPPAVDIYTALHNAILAEVVGTKWIPVTPSSDKGGLYLIGNYAGCSFSVSVEEMNDPVNTQEATGDQAAVRAAVIARAATLQTIGETVRRTQYFSAVNGASPNIEDSEITLSDEGGNPEITGGGATYHAANVAIAGVEKAAFDTQRVMVETSLA
jgi:hypothetical protein